MLNKEIFKKPLIYTLIGISILLMACSISNVDAANLTITPEDEGGIGGALSNINLNTGDTLFLQPGTYNKSSDRNIIINKSITIIGNGSVDKVIIDAQFYGRMFSIKNHNITFINITFINGNSSGDAGVIYNDDFDNISFINCKFINNTANGYGGAIMNNGGRNLALINCVFDNNAAIKDNVSGGALRTQGNNTKIINCSFINNYANGGGAIWMGNGFSNSIIENCNFTNNSAKGRGGAIYYYNSENLIMINCNFNDNSAEWGAAFFTQLTNRINITNTTFTNNTARIGAGGAIYSEANNFLIVNSSFNNNTALNETNGYGGAIITHGANVTIINTSFTGNIVKLSGGGIYVGKGHNFSVINSTFSNNTAQWGGAIYNQGPSSKINNSNFTGNIGEIRGGAICSIGNLNVTYCDFLNNRGGNGGAIYNNKNAYMSLSGNTMKGNSADLGQMIYNAGYMGVLTLTFLNNGTLSVEKGQTITLFDSLTDDMGNTVTGENIIFLVDGKIFMSGTSIEGHFDIDFIVPDFQGIIDISGDYIGHGEYQLIVLNGHLKLVIGTNSTINAPDDISVNQNINITGTATDKYGNSIANTIINVTVNGKNYIVETDSNGDWILSYIPTEIGILDISVNWAGNETHFGFTNTTTFDVTKIDVMGPDEDFGTEDRNNTEEENSNKTNEENNVKEKNSYEKNVSKDNNTKKDLIPSADAGMKNTGMPIIAIILMLLSVLVASIYRKEK